jgi:hypothetical protein
MYGEEESGNGRIGKSYGMHSILNFFEDVPIDVLFPTGVFQKNTVENFKSNCGDISCNSAMTASTVSLACQGNKLTSNLIFDYIQQYWKNYKGVGRFASFMLNQAHVRVTLS